MLDKLLHRDLSSPEHLTNVHLHHRVLYPSDGASFFQMGPTDETVADPRDTAAHRPISSAQFLNKKLRWITLGGQYDWTNKVYPSVNPPPFPQDISLLLRALFPETVPEAAIVNLYTPGDTLSMHRDVSEDSDCPLISISIGCDALFLLGLDPDVSGGQGKHAMLRLRSGDALCMAGPSRFAWHGVPLIIPDTCPDDLQDWPCLLNEDLAAEDGPFEPWRGWLRSKRINLNVRQMKPDS